MEGFDPRTSFGDQTSRDYDVVSMRGDEEETVAFLAGLASGKRGAGVGGGYRAHRLAAAGGRRAVDGIELSQDMVDRMREKPGGDQVQVTMGDMARPPPVTPMGWSTWCSTPSGTCSPRTTRSAASRTPPGT